MTDFSQTTLRLITDLLHDARVRDVTWDGSLATFTICFDCLRRNVDGSELDDRIVEFKLTGVQAVGVCYDSWNSATRPSQFEPPRRITSDELAEWPFRFQEASLWINSAITQKAFESARLDWFMGDERMVRQSACTFSLMFDQWGDFGLPMLNVCLTVGGDDFTITSGGLPLDVDEWEKQYAAWWTGWKKHWDERNSAQNEEQGEYDFAFPVGEAESPDLNCRPPAEPVFDLEPTDAPPEFINCIRHYFESHHNRDWNRLAQVYPNATLSSEERAKQLEGWNLTQDFGRWGYPRSIDEWWLEGPTGCVVLRGIEHQKAFENYAAENCETVWTFAMRKRNGKWITLGCSQGWPRHKSAKELPIEQKPWLKKWNSGSIT